jgi:DNA-binding MarR family transcriptional regulator
MLLAQYNLSRLLDRIERAGLVERRACEDDGRGQLVERIHETDQFGCCSQYATLEHFRTVPYDSNFGSGRLVAITERGKAIPLKMWPIYAQAVEATVGKRLSAKQAKTLDALLGFLIEGHPRD